MEQLPFQKHAVFIGLSKRKKEKKKVVEVSFVSGKQKEIFSTGAPGQGFLIKNSQSSLLINANPTVKFPGAPVPPHPHFSPILIPQS